jgi:hypothetical protein
LCGLRVQRVSRSSDKGSLRASTVSVRSSGIGVFALAWTVTVPDWIWARPFWA